MDIPVTTKEHNEALVDLGSHLGGVPFDVTNEGYIVSPQQRRYLTLPHTVSPVITAASSSPPLVSTQSQSSQPSMPSTSAAVVSASSSCMEDPFARSSMTKITDQLSQADLILQLEDIQRRRMDLDKRSRAVNAKEQLANETMDQAK